MTRSGWLRGLGIFCVGAATEGLGILVTGTAGVVVTAAGFATAMAAVYGTGMVYLAQMVNEKDARRLTAAPDARLLEEARAETNDFVRKLAPPRADAAFETKIAASSLREAEGDPLAAKFEALAARQDAVSGEDAAKKLAARQAELDAAAVPPPRRKA